MLTPETIASRRFDKQMGGYKQDEVEIFLQQVAAEYAKLLAEKEELEQKIEVLADKVEQYREDEDSLRSALKHLPSTDALSQKQRIRQTEFWKMHRRASKRNRWL